MDSIACSPPESVPASCVGALLQTGKHADAPPSMRRSDGGERIAHEVRAGAEILGDGEFRERPGGLPESRRCRSPTMRCGRGARRWAAPSSRMVAGSRRREPEDGAGERALARAVGTEQTGDLASVGGERDARAARRRGRSRRVMSRISRESALIGALLRAVCFGVRTRGGSSGSRVLPEVGAAHGRIAATPRRRLPSHELASVVEHGAAVAHASRLRPCRAR